MSEHHGPRIDWARSSELAPGVMAGFRAVSKAVAESGIDPALIELVKIRASQINGCAFCIEMHTADAIKLRISSEKLHLLPVWQEAGNVFSDSERVTLEYTEALTHVSKSDVSDNLYNRLGQHFDDAQIVNLTGAIALINAWNRIAKPLRYSLRGVLSQK